MKMRELLMELYKLFSADEKLLRLLYYMPKSMNDNPLSPDKPNILDMEDKWEIIDSRIRFSPSLKGLVDEDPICRIMFYPSPRRAYSGNYYSSAQSFNVDMFVHHKFNDVDMRLAWISDYIGDLLSNLYFKDIGTLHFVDGDNLSSPEGYFGYRLIFRYGDYQW